MATIKYSRQREAIKAFLATRTDHPTADTIYMNIKEEFPNISLGTVYRNLSLLSDLGEILKISTGNGADRFDGDISPHYHFMCTECERIFDIKMDIIKSIDEIASEHIDADIEGHFAYFYGKCKDCKIN